MELFRREISNEKNNNGLGEIIIARPTGAAVMCAIFAIIGIAIILYITFGERTKRFRASGYIVPTSGVIKIYPTQPGVVVSLNITEGMSVSRGQILGRISHDRVTSLGESRKNIDTYIAERRQSLETKKQIQAHHAFSHADI